MLYTKLAKPLLFRMDPEKAHHLIINSMSTAAKVPGALALLESLYGVKESSSLSSDLWGIHFHSPIGLAAGLDKNGAAVPAFSSVGFGFIEVGTVTPKSQPGNDKPRLFRLPEDQGLINRMGFNNGGAEALAANRIEAIAAGGRKVPVAVNIGKNKVTPNDQAEYDYRECLRILYPYGDFFVVNISSPNTPGLRSLQYGDELRTLLASVMGEMSAQKQAHNDGGKPVLVKIAPDVSEDELSHMVESIAASGASGIIATNTTISRDGLNSGHAKEAGGLSGKPVTARSTQVIRQIFRETAGKLPIIGCGGIFTSQDAYEKIRAGASLVEIYTALIYEGPGLIRRLNKELQTLIKQDGFSNITQAIGIDAM